MTTPTPENAPPGTEVVCVDAVLHPEWIGPHIVRPSGLDGLLEGEIYTVREHIDGTIPQIRLHEIVRPIRQADICEVGFASARFRLLNLAGLDKLLTEEAPKELETL